MNTYIEIKELIPEILELGWAVKNDTWTDCPWSVYDQLQADYVAYLLETGVLMDNQDNEITRTLSQEALQRELKD